MNTINLRILFKSNPSDLPDWVMSKKHVIYKITHILDGRSYIGLASDFYDRLVLDTFYPSHYISFIEYCKSNCTHRHLYNALRKYGCKNFEVSILESEVEDLRSREIYWISYYNSFSDGYNMTRGGDDWIQMRLGAVRTYPDTNGVSPNAIKAARDARLSKYPDTNGAPPEWSKAGRARMLELYPNTNGMPPQCNEIGRYLGNLPASRQKAVITNKANHDGRMAWHSKESIDKAHATQRLLYGCLPINSEDSMNRSKLTRIDRYGSAFGNANLPENRKVAVANARYSRLLGTIATYIDRLVADNLDINASNYLTKLLNKFNIERHIYRVLDCIDQLRCDSRWSSDMESIFSKFYIDNGIKIKSD